MHELLEPQNRAVLELHNSPNRKFEVFRGFVESASKCET